MTDTLEGKVAVVTGAGRGIGRATAMTLAGMGAKVVVNDLGGSNEGTGADASPADETVSAINELGGEAVASHDSVADYEAAGRIIDAAVDNFGRLDILVNNAGISAGAPIDQLDPELFATVVGVHIFGTYNCTRHAVEHLKAQDAGRIVNIVSRAGLIGTAGSAAYAAGKGGIYGFTNAICRDLQPHGITVNNVNPAATVTRMVTGAIERARERGVDTSSAERMISVAQQPESVAAVIAFLCTDAASHITGQTFFAQGNSVGLFGPLEVRQTLVAEAGWTPESLAEAATRLQIPALEAIY